MEKFARAFFSMRMMALALFVFLVAIGLATFLEAKFDTETAKIMVYNSTWFTLLLVYLSVCLLANIFTYRMFRREKIAILMFHLAFLVMLVGAAVTRFLSFEGMMIINEGEAVGHIYSADPYLQIRVNDGKLQYSADHKMFMSEAVDNDFSETFDFPNHKTPITIEYVDYEKNMVDSLVTNDSIPETSLEIVTNGMTSNYLSENDFLAVGDVALSYNKKDAMPGIQIWNEGAKLKMQSKLPINFLPMAEMQKAAREGSVADSLFQRIPVDSIVPLQMATLYRVADQQFVLKNILKHSRKVRVKDANHPKAMDFLTVKVFDGKKSTKAEIPRHTFPNPTVFNFNGLVYELGYGSKQIDLPFSVMCHDFRLERYPGSDSPTSFESDLSFWKGKKRVRKKQTLWMNNVIDHEGYRFFQSAYEPDETATILSVNHDWWGTNISYLGYLMMGIGMLLSLFSPVGRFRELNKLIKKNHEKQKKMMQVILALILSTSVTLADEVAGAPAPAVVDTTQNTVEHHDHDGHDHSQHNHEEAQVAPKPNMSYSIMSEEHSDELATLLIQDFKGRIIPLHTFCDQLLRKISRKNTYSENNKVYNAVQTVMSMHRFQPYWMEQNMVYVSMKGGLRDRLNMKGSRTSFRNLLNEKNQFKFGKEYNAAHRKPEGARSEFDKQVLKLGERFLLLGDVYSISWRQLKALPLEGDPNNKWSPMLDFKENLKGATVAVKYLNALEDAYHNEGGYKKASEELKNLKIYQRKLGKDVVPEESLVEMEVRYNKMNIFGKSQFYYLGIGLIMLVVFLFKVFFRPTARIEKVFKRISQVFIVLIFGVFVFHGYGLYMRMMITGHAPWSNGYEAVVFIAWITVLTGLIFSYKNAAVLAGAAILAFFMIFVTEMNLMDPEISPLQPVLKSYWLMIHVAIITASYGPLGIASILGLLNLILYIFRRNKNGKFVSLNISELTYVVEMNMMIGVIMLTVGTFLGGIWANESWGRYWGWDSKETWALVAVLTYAVILHLRYIPALKEKFTLNVVAFWGYASVLFTFFGVNFYLTGLHSYANGEAMGGLPDWVKYFCIAMYLFTEIASIRNQLYIHRDKMVPMAYFKKKLGLLVGILALVCLMLIWLGVEKWDDVLIGQLKVTGMFVGVTAIQYGIAYLVANKNGSKAELEEV